MQKLRAGTCVCPRDQRRVEQGVCQECRKVVYGCGCSGLRQDNGEGFCGTCRHPILGSANLSFEPREGLPKRQKATAPATVKRPRGKQHRTQQSGWA